MSESKTVGLIKRLLHRPPPVAVLSTASRDILESYENPELIEVVFRKTVAFRTFRDELSDAKTVLDFGGACGFHYKLADDRAVRWAVVETPAMVRRASELATDRLRFFATIDEAAHWLEHVDIMHSNGALQYTEDPETIINALCALQAPIMIWKRLALSETKFESRVQISRLVDHGPGSINGMADTKDVACRETLIPEPLFLACHKDYRLAERDGTNFRFELEQAP